VSTRKKWRTTWGNPDLPSRNHRSEKAVYDWIAEQAAKAALWRNSRSTVVSVWVDERTGRGWERFDRLDLREHTEFVAPTTAGIEPGAS